MIDILWKIDLTIVVILLLMLLIDDLLFTGKHPKLFTYAGGCLIWSFAILTTVATMLEIWT